MRQRRYAVVRRGLGGLPLHRRELLRGGLGLMTGAVIGGLSDSGDRFAEPEAEAEADPPAEEPEPDPEQAVWRRGDTGEEVRALQEQLTSTGYWCGVPDAGYGHVTEQAVFAVQKAHDLTRDGVAGPDVRETLATAYLPAPVSSGDHVEVHLASQLLLVVRGGVSEMVLNTSTANGEAYEFEGSSYTARTPTGDFAVWYTHGTGWQDGELGEMWRPMYYDGNYAIHGSGSIPPWPASHGCARVSVAAMDMIWADGLLAMDGRVLVS